MVYKVYSICNNTILIHRDTVMPKDYNRMDRIGDLIQHELAKLIQRELNDPRLGLITLSRVIVSKDGAHAKVYFTTLNNQPENIVTTLKVLKKASAFLRYHLAQQVKLRITPDLTFYYDEDLERATTLTNLIDEAVAKDQANNGHDENGTN